MYKGLTSDYLEGVLGKKVRIEILKQSGDLRIIATKPVDSEEIVELSSVTFKQPGVKRYTDVHKAVLGGESMGEAFKVRGIEFGRHYKGIYNHSLPSNFNFLFGTAEKDVATINEVSIMVGPQQLHYADILETFSPAIPWFALGGMPDDELLAKIQAFNELLAKVR